MPELPDVTVYIECLERRLVGQALQEVRIKGPFLLRTASPPLASLHGKRIQGFRRIGKRIVFAFEDDLFAVLHLMIAGRLRYKPSGAGIPGKIGVAAFDFPDATLLLTEASSQKRASLHLVHGEGALAALDPGGLEVMTCAADAFAAAVSRENRTLKRALTDPRILSGIGNAYSDEILHRARLSPVKRTRGLSQPELTRLFDATRAVLTEWTDRLRAEAGEGFPEKVTAFRDGMAVHGRYRKPCPDCGHDVQRIVYAKNETNYCATCQTSGKLLADRALSRLLKDDWPRTATELEERLTSRRPETRDPPE
ncbi:MAG: formamidopyrimidine-DNA glycosylase [Myxococcales bacterium]|nr:formamidopyrimidine-DNA glycosylase [Myxococcales bacterium]